MNRIFHMKKYLFLGFLSGCLALSWPSECVHAQTGSMTKENSDGAHVLSSDAYTFKMLLTPGVDVSVHVSTLPKKEKGNPSENTPNSGGVSEIAATIGRDFREGVTRVSEKEIGGGTEIVRYYMNSWCAYDDPRKGTNVRRTNMDGLFFPINNYHFPELLWAEPKTRQPDPKVKEGSPQINLYADKNNVLEVDASSGRPLRYSDGHMQWTYSYKEDQTPIIIPQKLLTALQRALSSKQ